MKKVYRYRDFDEDLTTNSGQETVLPGDWRIIREKPLERLWSSFLYGLFAIVSWCYLRFGLHARFEGRDKLKKVPAEKGYFIYANHTQPFGDPMIALAVGRGNIHRRNRAIASPANFGLPVLGRMLPYLGAIPTLPGRDGLHKMSKAISHYYETGQPVVIFPEAHVWPWYTGIRPFSTSSFHFPIQELAPVFAMTVTYQKRHLGSKPRTTIYIDGPYWPDPALGDRQQKQKIYDTVVHVMKERAGNSTYAYATYQKVE